MSVCLWCPCTLQAAARRCVDGCCGAGCHRLAWASSAVLWSSSHRPCHPCCPCHHTPIVHLPYHPMSSCSPAWEWSQHGVGVDIIARSCAGGGGAVSVTWHAYRGGGVFTWQVCHYTGLWAFYRHLPSAPCVSSGVHACGPVLGVMVVNQLVYIIENENKNSLRAQMTICIIWAALFARWLVCSHQ